MARRTFGKGLLLSLEVLIAALGLLVVVRTILGFSIQIEMEGELPWRAGRPGHPRRTNRPPPSPMSPS